MTKAIFITGTGTDVGKTYVTALLVKKMRDLGYNCGYFKPVLSGAELINGELIPGDCKYVLDMAGINNNPDKCVSYIFKEPVSPHLASEIERVSIKKEKIKTDFENLCKEYEYIVVEGAGGIFCPLNLNEETLFLTDIIKMLNLNVIIITSAKLGTLNSSILTTEYAKNHSINIKGIILNEYDRNNLMHIDNRKNIERLSGINILSEISKNQTNIEIEKEVLLSMFKEI